MKEGTFGEYGHTYGFFVLWLFLTIIFLSVTGFIGLT